MILLYIFINFIKYHHDCDSDNSNLLLFEEDLIDYQINCHNKKIQNINPKYLNNIKSISIFNDSNVVFKSNSNNNNHYEKLIIYDKANIKFENDFKFDYLEIYGSPTFSISSNILIQIDYLLIINQTYDFPYDLFQINENSMKSQNDYINHQLKEDEYVHECSSSEFMVSLGIENITYQCNHYGAKKMMKYEEFKNHKFNLDEGVVSIYKDEEIDYKLDEIIEMIAPSLILSGSAVNSVCFFDFYNSTQIANYKNSFNREIELWLYNPYWNETHVDKYWLKVKTDDIILSTHTYYHYCNDNEVPQDVEIIVIPKKTLTYIIIGSVSFIFFLFFSLLIIAFCVHRFCHNMKIYPSLSSSSLD